jgi:IS30 family transposase
MEARHVLFLSCLAINYTHFQHFAITSNGLLRQNFPKKTDFKKVTQCEVRRAGERLNTRPRKLLGYKTPGDLMAEHIAVLAA